MNIHEYRASSCWPVTGCYACWKAAMTVDEAVAAAEELGGLKVVKSQIHAGGRGAGPSLTIRTAGGVRVSKSIDEVRQNAEQMLGHVLVTNKRGRPAKKCNACTSKTDATSRASCTSACC